MKQLDLTPDEIWRLARRERERTNEPLLPPVGDASVPECAQCQRLRQKQELAYGSYCEDCWVGWPRNGERQPKLEPPIIDI